MGVPSTLFLTSFPLPPQATHRCTWRRVTCTRRWWSCCCTTDLTQRCETHLLSLYRVGRIGNFVQTQPRCLPAPQGARPSSIRGSVLELVEGLKTQIPNDASVAQRRFALERCSEILTGTVAFFDRFGLLNFDLYEC